MSLFSENSGRWMVVDQAVMKCGAADAVRAGGGRVPQISTGVVAWRRRQPNTLVLPCVCAWSRVGLRGSVNHTKLAELSLLRPASGANSFPLPALFRAGARREQHG